MNYIESNLVRIARERKITAPNISFLKDKHKGSDVYVIGSGSSLDYLPTSFFDNKITVSCNYVCYKIPSIYTVFYHYDDLQNIIDKVDTTVVIGKNECGRSSNVALFNGNYYWFDHARNVGTIVDWSCVDKPTHLIMGGTVIISTLWFAYHLGAKNIILCGVDQGAIDGNVNMKGYRTGKIENTFDHYCNCSKWFKPQIREVVSELRNRNVTVCSLNPFTDYLLEGHSYVPFQNQKEKDEVLQ